MNLRSIKLVAGEGSPETGACWMSALSYYAGEKWSDHPECVCPVVREFCIAINDALPDDESRGRIIGTRLLDPIGSKADDATTDARRWHLVDAAARRFVPFAFRAAGITDWADRLEAMPRVTPEHATGREILRAAAAVAVARAVAVAAADADADARERFIVDVALPVLDELLAIGSTTPVEMACDPHRFERILCGA